MAEKPGVEIPIQARVSGWEEAFGRIDGMAKKSAAGIKTAYATLGTVGAAVGVTLGLSSLVSVVTTLGAKTIDGERSLNQLNATLRATGNAAGLTARELDELGAEVQNLTVFDDDAIRKAETALLRFRTVQGDVFRDAIRLAPDLAAALSTDLPAAATALWKALTDPEGGMKALKSAGISLSEQQKDLAARFIEAGDKASAQKIVLDELRKSIGGSAAADSAGLYGSTQRLSRAWDDLQKAMGGKLLSDNKGVLDSTTGALERLNKMAKETKLSLYDLATTPFAALKLSADIVNTALGRDTGSRSASGKIRGLTSPEEIQAQAAAQAASDQEAADQAYIREQAALKRRVESVSAANASLFAAKKFYIDKESALYEAGYSRNEVATTEFYDQQRQAAQATTQAILQGLTKQGQAVEALMSAPSTSAEERAGLLGRLAGIGAESDKARFDLKKQMVDIDVKQSGAVRNLIRDYEDLEVQLAAISGGAATAARASFDASNRDRVDRVNAELNSGNPEAREAARVAAQRLQELRYATIQQGALTDATRDFQRTLDSVGDAQARIDIAVQSGALTEIEALRAVSEVRREKIDQLLQELDVARQVAEAIASPAARQQALDNIDAMQIRLEELAATGDLVAKKFNDIGASSFSQLLKDFTTLKPLDALKNFASNLSGKLTDTIADNLSQKAFGKDGIFSGFGETLSGLFGGAGEATGAAALTTAGTTLSAAGATQTTAGTLLTTAGTTLTSAAAALTSAAASLVAAATGSAASDATSDAVGALLGAALGGGGGGGGGFASGPQFGFAANGANFTSGMPYVVGEQGRELVIPPRGSKIVPNHKLAGMGRGNTTIVQHINVMPGADTRSARQAAVQAGDHVRGAIGRR